MKKLFLLLIVSSIFFSAFTQEEPSKKVKGGDWAKNSIYVNILGNGLPGGLTYDRIWSKNGFFNVSTSFGGLYLPINEFPTANGYFGVNMLMGKSKNMFEFSIGWTYCYMKFKPQSEDTQVYHVLNSTVRLGYRYQKPEGGFFFRGGLITHVNEHMITNDLVKTLFWELFFRENVQISLPGISLGYSF